MMNDFFFLVFVERVFFPYSNLELITQKYSILKLSNQGQRWNKKKNYLYVYFRIRAKTLILRRKTNKVYTTKVGGGKKQRSIDLTLRIKNILWLQHL